MRDNPLKVKYSHDCEYRYEIVKRLDGLFQVWVQERIRDEYLGDEELWCDTGKMAHLADTCERAEDIGDELLRNLSGEI